MEKIMNLLIEIWKTTRNRYENIDQQKLHNDMLKLYNLVENCKSFKISEEALEKLEKKMYKLPYTEEEFEDFCVFHSMALLNKTLTKEDVHNTIAVYFGQCIAFMGKKFKDYFYYPYNGDECKLGEKDFFNTDLFEIEKGEYLEGDYPWITDQVFDNSEFEKWFDKTYK